MSIWKRLEGLLFLAVMAGGFFVSFESARAQTTALTSCSFTPSAILASDSARRPTFHWTWNGSGSTTATVACTIHTPTFVTTPFPTVTYTGKGAEGILLNKISEGIGGTYMVCRVNGIECSTTLPITAYNSSGGSGGGGGGGSYGSIDVPNPIDPECKFSPNPISPSATSLASTFSWKGDSSSEYNVFCSGAITYGKVFSGSAALYEIGFSFDESARGKQEVCRVTNLSNDSRVVCQNVTLGIGSNASCSSQVCVSGAGDCANGQDTSGSCDGGKVCCKASTSTSCSGTDSSGASRSGTCSSSTSCSSGQVLSNASGCASGQACCFVASSESCEGTSGQKCSANCSSESGYQSGGVGTCSDSTKPQCCKSNGKDTSPSVGGGLVPCGNSGSPCTLCHLLLLVKNISDWVFRAMTYIAFAVLVAMGILYIVSAGSTQLIGMAKKGIWAALIGFTVVLLGWVAINVFLMVLADGTLASGTATFSIKTNGSWFEFNCDTTSKYLTGTSGGTGGNNSGGGTVTCGDGGCAKDEKVKAAVQNQTSMPANEYMAILQAGEHYNQTNSCSNASSPTGACGVSQTMPANYKSLCGFSSCEDMRADINKDIACGAKVAAGFKSSHNVPCKQDASKKIDCTIDGIKSLAGCYNRGYQCNISPRNVSGKWYDCGEFAKDGKSYCDRVSEYFGSCK